MQARNPGPHASQANIEPLSYILALLICSKKLYQVKKIQMLNVFPIKTLKIKALLAFLLPSRFQCLDEV